MAGRMPLKNEPKIILLGQNQDPSGLGLSEIKLHPALREPFDAVV